VDLAVPVVVLGGLLTGVATLIESAALTVVYAFLVEVLIHRGLSARRDVPRLALECATLIGGFLIILSVALGFTSYLILLEVPARPRPGSRRMSSRRWCFCSPSTSSSSSSVR
jgi:TRAP-type C4-dicarboxylate transport system permease large subunit